jgi:hypothetical protein
VCEGKPTTKTSCDVEKGGENRGKDELGEHIQFFLQYTNISTCIYYIVKT